MGESRQPVRTTIMSVIEGVANFDAPTRRQKLDEFIDQYGDPLLLHLERRWQMDRATAEDTLQEFFLTKFLDTSNNSNLARKYLDRRCEPGGKTLAFRSYLYSSLNNYVRDQKRIGSRIPTISLDGDIGRELGDDSLDQQDRYTADWAANLLSRSIHAVQYECQAAGQDEIWLVFEARILAPLRQGTKPPDYDCLVKRMGFATAKIASNRLRTAIRKFNRILRGLIREYLPADNAEELERALEDELADLRRVIGSLPTYLLNPSCESPQQMPQAPSTNVGSLFCLNERADSIWNLKDDLAQIWHHTLSTKIDLFLPGWRQAAGNQLPDESSLRDEALVTLKDVWRHSQPPLGLLKSIKQQAKNSALKSETSGRGADGNGLPSSVNVVLYTTSIAIAQQRLGIRITNDNDQAILPRLGIVLDYDWLDEDTREILDDWRDAIEQNDA